MGTVRNMALELTFIPNRPGRWKEFLVEQEAIEATAQFNSALRRHPSIIRYQEHAHGSTNGVANKGGPSFWGKADLFRSCSDLARTAPDGTRQPHPSWCLEVNSAALEVESLASGQGTPLWDAIDAIYQIAASLNMYPYIESPVSRRGVQRQWPTGGGHLHVPINLWMDGPDYLLKLFLLERALCVDYANHPFIRWLFCQWGDDVNSAVALDAKGVTAATVVRRKDGLDAGAMTRMAHGAGLDCHAIKQRIGRTGKPILPTYEFRFFDMPRTTAELALQTKFLTRWMDHHIALHDISAASSIYTEPTYTLTTRVFNRLTRDMGYAKAQVRLWFKGIGLDFADYEALCWERQYLPRMKWGKAL